MSDSNFIWFVGGAVLFYLLLAFGFVVDMILFYAGKPSIKGWLRRLSKD